MVVTGINGFISVYRFLRNPIRGWGCRMFKIIELKGPHPHPHFFISLSSFNTKHKRMTVGPEGKDEKSEY